MEIADLIRSFNGRSFIGLSSEYLEALRLGESELRKRRKSVKSADVLVIPPDNLSSLLDEEDVICYQESQVALRDITQVENWARSYKFRVLERMQESGLEFSKDNYTKQLIEYSAKVAEELGFRMAKTKKGIVDGIGTEKERVRIKGRPYNVTSGIVEMQNIEISANFFDVISEGYLFIETVPERGFLQTHGAYTHLLQCIYLAENVEGFPGLYKKLAITDKNSSTRLFSGLMDNTRLGGVANPELFHHWLAPFMFLGSSNTKINYKTN